jgi:hypothetical protein
VLGENCGTGDETFLWCRLLLLGEIKFMGLNVQKGWQSLTKNGRGRAAFSSMGDAACPRTWFVGREWLVGRLH